MDNLILIDTDILIDVARNIQNAVTRLDYEEKKTNIGISVVTQMELIVGCKNKRELSALDKFLDRFDVIPLNTDISGAAVDLLRDCRLSQGLLIADALIAATGIVTKTPSSPKIKNTISLLKIYICFRIPKICRN